MNKRVKITFLLLVFTQALHSLEEYIGQLWEVFAAARFLSGLVSNDLEKGFLIINIALFAFGLLCFLILQNAYFPIRGLLWFWIIIEFINGIGHPLWALYEKDYVPGLATAPVLLILSIYLSLLLLKNSQVAVKKHQL